MPDRYHQSDLRNYLLAITAYTRTVACLNGSVELLEQLQTSEKEKKLATANGTEHVESYKRIRSIKQDTTLQHRKGNVMKQ